MNGGRPGAIRHLGGIRMVQLAQLERGIVHFGIFEVDLGARQLRRQGIKIRLQDQPFKILEMLLEHLGEITTREQLRQRIWPADTFVDFDQGLYNAINKLREALRDTAETPRYVETVPRRGYRFIGPINAVAEPGSGRIRSVAVLPLENLSGDPEQEYFADGLTESLITSLARISALRVISRTTTMHYKKARRPLPEIARELQVDGIVEGTVLRSGDRVRISAQLINARTDGHVWTDCYDRELRDILTLQSEVARAIAGEIQITLIPQALPPDPVWSPS
jgi:TolB-like protein